MQSYIYRHGESGMSVQEAGAGEGGAEGKLLEELTQVDRVLE